jgi:hypothetical protein
MSIPEYISNQVEKTDFCPECRAIIGQCNHKKGIKESYIRDVAEYHIQIASDAASKRLRYQMHLNALQNISRGNFHTLLTEAQKKVDLIVPLIEKLSGKIHKEKIEAANERAGIENASKEKLSAVQKCQEESQRVATNLKNLLDNKRYGEFVQAPGINEEIPELVMANVGSLKTLSESSMKYEAGLIEKLRPQITCEARIQELNGNISQMEQWPEWQIHQKPRTEIHFPS